MFGLDVALVAVEFESCGERLGFGVRAFMQSQVEGGRLR